MSWHQTESLFDSEPVQDALAGERIIRVAHDSGADSEFDYAVPDSLWPVGPGQRVEVPFGKADRPQKAFCVESDIPREKAFGSEGRGIRLKRVLRVVDAEPLLDTGLMDLARWISAYYVCPLGQVLAAMVPGAVKKGAGLKTQKYIYLAENARDAAEALRGKKQKLIVAELRRRKAFDPDSGVELRTVLEVVGCGPEPVKRLAEKTVVRLLQKTTFTALPAIPEAMFAPPEQVVLNEDQQKALAHIESQIACGRFGVTLLHGVTDSGKTELYMRAIRAVLDAGRTAVVLLPEIALTAQTVQRFNCRFEDIAVMHSALTAPQRNVQWQMIRSGRAKLVIGARSAVFAPLANLGLIVVDEEHEPSYKQDTAPRYNGRDVAIKRAQLAGAHCILGTATPSLEMLSNCRDKKHFTLVRLPKRVMDLPMPKMKLIDMRRGVPTRRGIDLISAPLAKHLAETLAKNEQAILLLNRRGYSSFVFCPSCRHTLHCRNCDVTLTFHKSKSTRPDRMQTVTGKHMNFGFAVCHYCLARTLVPQKCPVCGKGLAMIGLGSQRLEEELAAKFPDARIARIDSDSMAGRDYYSLLRDFARGRIDILAGTQMLAKGLHFPNVTLVGIISADTCLYLPDFRANERTFQLISQVAGRAGRSAKSGAVLVQTFLPDQPAIRFALDNDFDGFAAEECKNRKNCNLPPFWRLAAIVMRDNDFDRLDAASKNMRQTIDRLIGRQGLNALVRGPVPPVISRIQRSHRLQIIIRTPDAAVMHRLFESLRSERPVRPAVKVAIDIDPVNLL